MSEKAEIEKIRMLAEKIIKQCEKQKTCLNCGVPVELSEHIEDLDIDVLCEYCDLNRGARKS